MATTVATAFKNRRLENVAAAFKNRSLEKERSKRAGTMRGSPFPSDANVDCSALKSSEISLASHSFYRAMADNIYLISNHEYYKKLESQKQGTTSQKNYHTSVIPNLVIATLGRECDPRKPFTSYDFSSTDLSGMHVHRGCFQHANFSDSDLRAAEFMGGNFRSGIFYGADLLCADFSPAPLIPEEVKGDMRDFEADIVTKLRKPSMEISNAIAFLDLIGETRLNPRRTDMTSAKLLGARLDRAVLWGAVLVDADFRPRDKTVTSARYAQFVGADLQKAEFWRADLERAVFIGANMRGVNLRGANLQCTDFSGVDLREVVGVTAEQLGRAQGDSETKPPPGISVSRFGECR